MNKELMTKYTGYADAAVDTTDVTPTGGMMVTTPQVIRQVQSHFGCTTMKGAPLEDWESESRGFHWDQHLFEGELMDAASGKETGTFSLHALTDLTLALLQDSGWCVHWLLFIATSLLQRFLGPACMLCSRIV
jgi:hypothetical protein